MTQTSPSKSRECIVLVHGLAASTHFMRPLEKHFARLGFQVHNWGYPSIRDVVAKNARRMGHMLHGLERGSSIDQIYIIAHSMGSIVTRAALMEGTPSSLDRVVFLGPPNCGSPIGPGAGCDLPGPPRPFRCQRQLRQSTTRTERIQSWNHRGRA